MRRSLATIAALALLSACTDDETTAPSTDLSPPTNLRYQLNPSGNPTRPDGILLRWDAVNDDRIANFVVYSRGSMSESWSRRAETTSQSFHDTGNPHLQYYVTSEDASGRESRGSNAITVDERNRMRAPSSLSTVTLNRAIQLSWSADARLAAPELFDYYRIYSTLYDLDAGTCNASRWALEGTTVSEDFVASGLPNGVPRCFAVSTISRDGHESVTTRPKADTPRYDARNVLVYAAEASLASSGFRFYLPTASQYGVVMSGDRPDIDFRVERRSDGSLWMRPVRSGTVIARARLVADLTSIDDAPPRSEFSASAIEAVPGYLYVFETTLTDGLHYGALRITHVASDYVIFDWSYQSDPGNPMLQWVRGGGEEI